ncbi:MAG: hypothetical protein K0Q68_1898 [Moraxellaceae bacterium]|jgi:acetyl esterase/lipase|nr:hypothetical protein [Moraxellaceae bacterium]
MPRSAPLLLVCLLAALPLAEAGAGPWRDRAGNDAALEADDDRRSAPALPAGSRVLRDLAYGPSPRQVIDIYLPPGATAAPLLVMVHGGAWRFGDKAESRVVDNKVARWLPRGIGVVSVNYRLLPQADVAQQAEDVAAALAFVQRQAPEWGADPREIILMGHSAGAHLVALLGARPARVIAAGGSPWRGTVALDSAALDVEALMGRRHQRFHDRAFGKDPAQWAALSPRAQAGKGATPMLLVCSTERRDHPCDDARAMAATLAAQGVPARLQPEARSHRDINGTLGLDNDYTRAVEAFMAGLSPVWRERLEGSAPR